MSHLTSITAAATKATSSRYGLLQLDLNLKEALLKANQCGALTITNHNKQYCTLQGIWNTPDALIRHATHFEMIDNDTIMLKQGGAKMRAFKISAE